jgi:hypothetical protein
MGIERAAALPGVSGWTVNVITLVMRQYKGERTQTDKT